MKEKEKQENELNELNVGSISKFVNLSRSSVPLRYKRTLFVSPKTLNTAFLLQKSEQEHWMNF